MNFYLPCPITLPLIDLKDGFKCGMKPIIDIEMLGVMTVLTSSAIQYQQWKRNQ